MGPGMGAVLSRAGLRTALHDVSEEALERARTAADLAAGVLERLEAPIAPGGSLRFEPDLAAAVADADVVMEAGPEDPHPKHPGPRGSEGHGAGGRVRAPHTPGLPLTPAAQARARPPRAARGPAPSAGWGCTGQPRRTSSP